MSAAEVPRLNGEVHVRGADLPPDVGKRLTALVRELTGGPVTALRALTGGLWAHTHALDVDAPGGPRRLALRRYVRWRPGQGPDEECRRHALVLAGLHGSGLPVAELLWSDPDGEVLDVPALLTTLLPGAASLTLAATPPGLDRLGAVLAAVHAVPPPADLAGGSGFAAWVEKALQETIPRWLAPCPDRQAVLAALAAGAGTARSPARLAHGDFHAGNVLWSGEGEALTVTGVVDWDVARAAPPGADVGYCRADLAMAFGQQVADGFAYAYDRHAGPLPDAAWWDLLGAALCWPEFREWVAAYHVFGIPGLTADLMGERLTQFTRDALVRAGSG